VHHLHPGGAGHRRPERDLALEGTTADVVAEDVLIHVRNYDGDVLRDGNVEGITERLLTAVRDWEYEPLPPVPTTFSVVTNVGD
jgi:hypothetical protein